MICTKQYDWQFLSFFFYQCLFVHLREYESQLWNILHPDVLSSFKLRHISKFGLTAAIAHQAGYFVRRLIGTGSGSIKYPAVCTSMFSMSLTFQLLWTHISERWALHWQEKVFLCADLRMTPLIFLTSVNFCPHSRLRNSAIFSRVWTRADLASLM